MPARSFSLALLSRQVPAVMPAVAVTLALAGAAVRTCVAADLTGRVLQVTTDAVFLDRGAADGLQPGTRISLQGGSGRARELTVVRVSDHRAAATKADPSLDLAAGEAWVASGLAPQISAADTSAARLWPEPVDPERLSAAWEAALAAPAPLQQYRPSERSASIVMPEGRHRLRVTPAVLSWPYRGGASKSYTAGLLSLRGESALSGRGAVRLRLDCDLMDWPKRPDADRLRPREKVWALVHALSLDYARDQEGWSASLGRTRPSGAPGVPLFDGGVISWASASRGPVAPPLELGIYGGYAPDPLTLNPSHFRLALGAFAAADGRVGEGTHGSARGRLSLLRAGGVSQENGQVLVALIGGHGISFDGGASVAHPPGTTRLTNLSAELHRRTISSEISVGYRRSEPVLDPAQAAAYREVLGGPAQNPGRTERGELGFWRNIGAGGRLETFFGRSSGTGGFDRWTGEGRFAHSIRLGPLSRWLIGYRGSSGWQEGHEGEVGFGLVFARWQTDLTAGGGLVRQDPADRTEPIGRGILSLRRPLGKAGSLDVLVSGQGGSHFFSAAGRFALSWRLNGGRG